MIVKEKKNVGKCVRLESKEARKRVKTSGACGIEKCAHTVDSLVMTGNNLHEKRNTEKIDNVCSNSDKFYRAGNLKHYEFDVLVLWN